LGYILALVPSLNREQISETANVQGNQSDDRIAK
jgi:hypothetical protein